MSGRRLVLPGVAAALALALFLFGRGYPWPVAMIAALAIGAFAHALRRTVEQVRLARQAHRVDKPPPEEAGEG